MPNYTEFKYELWRLHATCEALGYPVKSAYLRFNQLARIEEFQSPIDILVKIRNELWADWYKTYNTELLN